MIVVVSTILTLILFDSFWYCGELETVKAKKAKLSFLLALFGQRYVNPWNHIPLYKKAQNKIKNALLETTHVTSLIVSYMK